MPPLHRKRTTAQAWQIIAGRRKSPKIGIHNDLPTATFGAAQPHELKAPLRCYRRNVGYLAACRDGAARIYADGKVARLVRLARRLMQQQCSQLAASAGRDANSRKQSQTHLQSQPTERTTPSETGGFEGRCSARREAEW